MNLWSPAPTALVWHSDDILVIPLDQPLQQPLRLTGSAVDCLMALLRMNVPATARTLAMSMWSDLIAEDGAAVDIDSVAADVDQFFVSLAVAGIVVAEGTNGA